MFPTAQEIARSREHAVDNLLSFSHAWLDSAGKLCDALSGNSRDALSMSRERFADFGAGRLGPLLPDTVWSDQGSRLLDTLGEIVAAHHRQVIEHAEAQIRVFDELVFAAIHRAGQTAPWESAVTLGTLRASLEGAERALRSMTETAQQTVDLAEHELHQLTVAAVDTAPAEGRPRRTGTA